MRFLRIFGRRGGKPVANIGAVGETWSVGNLAECVTGNGQWLRFGDDAIAAGPRGQEVNRVSDVDRTHNTAVGNIGLVFTRYGRRSYAAENFRKLIPHADAAERADAAFIATLCPAPVPAPQREPA